MKAEREEQDALAVALSCFFLTLSSQLEARSFSSGQEGLLPRNFYLVTTLHQSITMKRRNFLHNGLALAASAVAVTGSA